MCKLFNDWSSEIRRFCEQTGLSFEKIEETAQSWNDNSLLLAYDDHDPEKGKMGLLDDTPMPAVLFITKNENGELIFETTEFTEKYLREGVPVENRKIG